MPDFFDALRKNGLSNCIPQSTKQRRYSSRSQSYSASQRHTTHHKAQFDWRRYEQQVPPEYRYGTSFKNAMQHSTPREMKAMSNHANDVFADAIASLDRCYYRSNRW